MIFKKSRINLLCFFILICILLPQIAIANLEQNIKNEENYIEESLKYESILKREASQELGTDTNKNNANLKLMRVGYEGLTPSFESDVYEYYLTVPSNIKDLEVVCNSQNPNANIEIKGNTNLKDGLNIIEINVISENKTKTQKYKIEVTKIENLELANTNLETLAIENTLLNPVFDNNIVHYTAEVSYLVNDLRTLIIPENENAVVNVEGVNNLKVGKNEVLITVIAQNGYTKKEILIDVYKNDMENKTNEEEQNYEQEEKQESYKIEETSNDNEKENFEPQKLENVQNIEKVQKENNNQLWIIILELIILIGIVSIVIYNKKRRNK